MATNIKLNHRTNNLINLSIPNDLLLFNFKLKLIVFGKNHLFFMFVDK